MIWRSSYHSRIVQLADLLIAFCGFILANMANRILYNLAPSIFPREFEFKEPYYILALFISFIYVVLFYESKAYSYQRFTSLFKEFQIVFKVCSIGLLVVITIIFLVGFREIPRTYIIVYYFISLTMFLTSKAILFYVASFIRKKGKNRKRVLLIGTGERTNHFIKIVKNNFNWGIDIVGILTGNSAELGTEINGIKIINYIFNIEEVLKTMNPEEVIITLSTNEFNQIRDVIEECEKMGVNIRLNSDFFSHITKNIQVDNVFGINIISFYMTWQSEFQLFIKRLIDILGASLALILFSPFMFIAVIGIWITDGKPIFYKWNVVGLNKKPFQSWKFRTMVKDADKLKSNLNSSNEMEGPVFKIKNDPRILPFGRWLRKWSIDETPQLFSVLKGDMSLVGPRPSFPHELIKFESWQRRKLSVKPGITCLWQINGRNKIFKFDEWVKLDLYYIDNWSIWLDIQILFKTIPSVILGKGAS